MQTRSGRPAAALRCGRLTGATSPDGGEPVGEPTLPQPVSQESQSPATGQAGAGTGTEATDARPVAEATRRFAASLARGARTAGRYVLRGARAGWMLLVKLIGALLRGVVYLLASPVTLIADIIQPDADFDRNWVIGFMGFVTVLIVATWGFGYLVTGETLQGNSLVAAYADLGPDLAAVPYLDEIEISAAEFGVDPALLAAMIEQESGFDPNAVSRAGARGLMQIMPGTWAELCPGVACDGRHSPPSCGNECIFDPAANIRAGTRYFAALLDRFDGNAVMAFAAYNAGTAAVERYASEDPQAGSINNLPPFAETRTYVYRVLSLWVRLRSGGVPDVVTLSVEETRLLRQVASILPASVLALWALFAVWVYRRVSR